MIIRYEDLECWQLSKELAVDIYSISMHGKISRDFTLRDQLRKSAISVVSNITEGKERGTCADFMRFLYIAKASAAELRTQLMIANEIQFLEDNDFDDLNERVLTVSKKLASLIKSMKKKKS